MSYRETGLERRAKNVFRNVLGLVKPNTVEEISKPWIVTQRVKVGMNAEEFQNVGLLLVALLEPSKRLIVVAESQISVHKGGGRNVASLLASLQLCQEPRSVRVARRRHTHLEAIQRAAGVPAARQAGPRTGNYSAVHANFVVAYAKDNLAHVHISWRGE